MALELFRGRTIHQSPAVWTNTKTLYQQYKIINQKEANDRLQEITKTIIHQTFSLVPDWSKQVTWLNIPQLKLANIQEYSPIFKTALIAKKILRMVNTKAFIWGKNMLVYLSLAVICSSKLHSLKTVCFSEQILNVRGQIS